MKKLFLLLALVGLFTTACSESNIDDSIDNKPSEKPDDDNEEDPIFEINAEDDILIEAEGGEVIVNLSTNLEYNIDIPEEAKAWLSIANTRAVRNEKLTFIVAENETEEVRRAVVRLLDGNNYELISISITQKGAIKKEPIFEVDAEGNIVVGAEGGEVVITVATDIEYDVIISDGDEEWISVADTRAELRTDRLTFTVVPNNSNEERSASIELVNKDKEVLQTINIIQEAQTKIFETDCNDDYIVVADGGEVNLAITTNIEYDVVIPDGAQEWISVTDTRAELRTDRLTFTVAPNNSNEERSASIELVNNDKEVLQTINIIQEATTIISCAKNEIWYTSSDGNIIEPYSTDGFGANILSNTYKNGKGVITFDSDITTIGYYAFDCCDSLTSITIPDSVTTIKYMAFNACDSLTSVTIPDSVTTIEDSAFDDCDSLTSVTIPDSVTTIGEGAFAGCTSLKEFNGKFAADNGRCLIVDGVLISFAIGSGLTEYTIPNSVTTIGDYAFSECDSLTSVTIPDSVTTIGGGAFRYCDSLTSVTIPDSVTTIRGGAFFESGLKSVTIGDGVTRIGETAFSNCQSLSKFNGKFASDNGRCLIMDRTLIAYAEASGTEYTIPDSVTTIGDDAFYGCDSLTSVTIPDSVTTIGEGAFAGCIRLTSVTIGDSVTTIGGQAFDSCHSLTSVTIPDSVTTIGFAAFTYCKRLTSVYCKPTTPPIVDYGITDWPPFEYNAENRIIYVPKGSVSAYRNAKDWREYAECIKGYNF